MKKKILLFISFVLLAAQGWANLVEMPTTNQNELLQCTDFFPPKESICGNGSNGSNDSIPDLDFNDKAWKRELLENFFSGDIVGLIFRMAYINATPGLWFDETTVNGCMTKSFNVYGEYMYQYCDYITLTLDDTTGMFSIDRNMIPVSEVEQVYTTMMGTTARGTWVPVKYNPTSLGSHEAKIIINAGSKISKVEIKLVGTAVERHLTASALSSFRTLTVGESDTIPIHVEGTNLNGPVTVTLDNHYSNNDMFSIDKLSLDPDATGAINDDVMLIYTPTTVGAHGVSVDVSGGGASGSASVVLTGHCEPPAHIITVDNPLLNFGTVVKGETSSPKSFTVKGSNLTNDLILSLSPACSHYTINPTRITPADAAHGAQVTVTYHPLDAGTHNVSLTINEEGQLNGGRIVSLNGKCVANPTITVNPTSLDFETIEVGQEKPMTINVSGTDLTGPITVTKEETIGDQFSINKETLSASGGSIIVTYKPTEAGTHGGCIRISGGDATAVSVSLTGTARELSVTKSSLDFGTIKKNETAPRTFTVYGGNLLGDVTLLSTKPDLFEVIPETITPSEAKAGKEVTVIYKPTAGGTHSGKIIVSAEGVTNKEVAVSGKCAEIKVNKTSLNFGTIEVGKDTTLTFNIIGANITGQISLLLEETISGQFSITSPANLKLPASGGSVTVKYKPTEGGTHGGRIRISGEGEGADPVSVSLNGSARELSVTKTSLDFGTIKKTDTPRKKKFTVYGKNLAGNVTLTSTNSRFTVTPSTITPAEAKAGKEVTVTYTPTAGGTHSGYIIVKSSGVTPDSVSVTGKCATISANPSSYNFGNVPVGKPVTKEITITGTNVSSSITILVEETEGGQFTINKRTLPATGGTVIVTFKPTDAKTFGAALRISGGSAEAVSVSLTGKGVTPTITRNKSTLTFTGSSITSDYVKVTGTNLDDVISLTVTGSTNFTVSPSTISISDAADGKQVKVTCNPKNASSAEATLKITSPYASTKYVTLKYSRGSNGGGEVQVSAVQPEGGDEDTNNEFTNGGLLETTLNSTTDVSELAMNSKVYAEGLNIIIESPVEQKAVISDISGRARSVNLQAGRNEIPVNASGIYIVRIREKTTKLMLK